MSIRPCHIAIADNLAPVSGESAIPGYSLQELIDDPGVVIRRITQSDTIRADDLEDVDILISLATGAAITRHSFPRSGRLAGIVRVGVGYDDVDVDACTDSGVALCVPREAVRRPTAVAALTLLLALATRLLDKHRITLTPSRDWHRRADLVGMHLEGKVLGVIGCGSIGSELFSLCAPLGLRHIATDPFLSVEQASAKGIELCSLEHLLQVSDFVSIHCLHTAATDKLIDRERLALMKPSAYLINTARGGIVDQEALFEMLSAGRLAGAGLDVLADEPPKDNDPILGLDNVVFSAHALNWTSELGAIMSRSNICCVRQFRQGCPPPGLINEEVAERRDFLRKLQGLAGLSQ